MLVLLNNLKANIQFMSRFQNNNLLVPLFHTSKVTYIWLEAMGKIHGYCQDVLVYVCYKLYWKKERER